MTRKYLLSFLLILASLFPTKTLADITYWEPQIKYAGQLSANYKKEARPNITDEYKKQGNFEYLLDWNDATCWDSDVYDYTEEVPNDSRFVWTGNTEPDNWPDGRHFLEVELEDPIKPGEKFWFMAGIQNVDSGNGDWCLTAGFDIFNGTEYIDNRYFPPTVGQPYRCENDPITNNTGKDIKTLRFVVTRNINPNTNVYNEAKGEISKALRMRLSRFQVYKQKTIQIGDVSLTFEPNEIWQSGEKGENAPNGIGNLNNDYGTYWDSGVPRHRDNDNDLIKLKFNGNITATEGDILYIKISTPNEQYGEKGFINGEPRKILIRSCTEINGAWNDWNTGAEIFPDLHMGEDRIYTFVVPNLIQNDTKTDVKGLLLCFEQSNGYTHSGDKGAVRLANIQIGKEINFSNPGNSDSWKNLLNDKIKGKSESIKLLPNGKNTFDSKRVLDGDRSTYIYSKDYSDLINGNDFFEIQFENPLTKGAIYRVVMVFPENAGNSLVKRFWFSEDGYKTWNKDVYVSDPDANGLSIFYFQAKTESRNIRLYIEDSNDIRKGADGKDYHSAMLSDIVVEKMVEPGDVANKSVPLPGGGTISIKDIEQFYETYFNNYKLAHTHGFVEKNYDNINNAGGHFDNINGTWDDNGKFNSDEYSSNIQSRPGNQLNFSEYITSSGIEMPDYSYVTKDSDSRVTEGVRQPTYTIVHELRARPGERVDLYPFSDIHLSTLYGDEENRGQYSEQFVRWYNYSNDKVCDYIYFLQDPSKVCKTEFGHVGGRNFINKTDNEDFRSPITVASFFYPETINGETQNKVPEMWIAADFSLDFGQNKDDRLNKYKDTDGRPLLIEPQIHYRHIFHITPASEAAEKFSGSIDNNKGFIKKNRRFISTRAGEMFKIRLDNSMPDPENTFDYRKTERYYKTSDGSYSRIGGFALRVYQIDDSQLRNLDNLDFTSLSDKTSDLKLSCYGRSGYTSMTSHFSYDVFNEFKDHRDRWIPNKQRFFRAIYCPKPENPDNTKRVYVIRVLATDGNNNVLKVYGTTDDLVVQEYVVTTLPSNEASFLTEDEYNELNGNGEYKYETHREDYLKTTLGNPEAEVNFDKYIALYGTKFSHTWEGKFEGDFIESRAVTNAEYTENKVAKNDGQAAFRKYKLPLPWDMLSYGFGYNMDFDYNIYRLADHSAGTSFKKAAMSQKSEYSDPLLGAWLNGSTWRVANEYAWKDLTWPENKQIGVYDRLFYDTNGAQRGLFFYVNAASDPGEIVKIPINNLCPGSRVYVSAWVNEFTEGQPETANVIFNFKVKVNENGNIVTYPLNGFTTGYVKRSNKDNDRFEVDDSFPDNPDDDIYSGGNQGKWHHAYWSFVPDLTLFDIDPAKVEGYELVLENNCVSSKGADYAIDKIECFIVPPYADATQLTPLCRNDNKQVEVRIELPWERFLYSIGEEEAKEANEGRRYKVHYIFYDTDKYEKLKNENNSNAFLNSIIQYHHKHGNGDNDTDVLPWGTVNISTCYASNNIYSEENFVKDQIMRDWRENIETVSLAEDEKNVCFIAWPEDNQMKLSNRYTIVIYAEPEEDGSGQDYFDADNYLKCNDTQKSEILNSIVLLMSPEDKCAKKSTFRVHGSGIVKIDGVLQSDADNITCCENQRPVVQIDLYAQDKNGDNIFQIKDKSDGKSTKDQYLDWFAGSYEEFCEYESGIEELDSKGIWDVLINFRKDYPTATTWDMPVVEESKLEENAPTYYTSQMRDYLKGLCNPIENENGVEVMQTPKLFLYQASYVFPAVKLDPTESSKYVFVTAIPIDWQDDETTIGYRICTEPTEVRMKVMHHAPTLLNGFHNAIDYPETMDNVPLRIGLNQLAKVQSSKIVTNPDHLIVPLRSINPVTKKVTSLISKDAVSGEDKEFIYLAETNDPEYQGLGEINKDESEVMAASLREPNFGLRQIGTVERIVAVKGQEDSQLPAAELYFNDNIKFKEGYYYKLKFTFVEDMTGVDLNGELDYEEACHGETVFTIKVVPEYQKWIGSEGVNWNNDANWSRVSSGELLVGSERLSRFADYTTDGKDSNDNDKVVNSNAKSYAPLDFTKVIIPAGANYPQLAQRNHDRAAEGSLNVNNGYGSRGYIWSANAPGASVQNQGDVTTSTENIQYDMAAVTYAEDGNVYCRPWYANAAKQVHFNTNAEILNQQHLDYQKAWVDMEMTPGRWYTAAMPLKEVVAGDMYLPSKGTSIPGRQNTELFLPIEFAKNDLAQNDRFAPAVYQRGWDKGNATVYELPTTSQNETRNVKIALDWSHVYNDVQEPFTPGLGYSIKTDVSRLDNFKEGATDKQEFVKFRFPKADSNYKYQTDASEPERGDENGKPITRTNPYRLAEFTDEYKVSNSNGSKFFLVGNPFMSHLDMAKFLDVNKDKIAPKYWIMSGDSQLAAVMDKDSKGFYGKADEVTVRDFSTVPPMQGFFVEANSESKELNLKFTPEMMKVEAYSPTVENGVNRPLLTSTRSGGDDEDRGYRDDVVTISAGGSVALLRMNPDAVKGYDGGEDVQWLDDSNQRGVTRVYTVAGEMATSINQTPDFEGVEIGVAAASEDEETELRFDGELIDGVQLLDTKTGEVSVLEPGFTMTVKGSASGRFFLTGSSNVDPIIDDAIKIYKESGEVVVKAPEICGVMTVRVFDTVGRIVATTVDDTDEIRISLPSGIYIVEARGSDSGRKTAKLRL